MKNSAIILILALFAAISCNRPETPDISLESAELLSFPGKGGKGEIVYSVENAYKTGLIMARSESRWISDFDFTTAGKVTFTVSKSNVSEPRSGSINVSYDNDNFSVNVYQAKAEPELLLMSADTLYFTPSGGSGLIEYRLQFPDEGYEINVTTEDEWLSGLDWSQEDKVSFNVEAFEAETAAETEEENEKKAAYRDGKIRISYWEVYLEVVIRQFLEEIQEGEE